MADLGNDTFDPNAVEPNAPYEVLPAGDYVVQIVADAFEPNSAGTGRFLKLELEVAQGDQKGRKLYDRLNLENPNQQAVDIAKRTLSAICAAVGVTTVLRNTDPLHFKQMIAVVEVKERRDRAGEYSNNVKGYKPVGGSTNASTGQSASGGKPATATGGGAPWKRNG